MSTTQHDGYTMTDREPVTLAGTTYQVREQIMDNGSREVWLHGPRGAAYFLRPYIERGGDTGIRQVVSWRGGPMRRRGNEVRVVEVAGHIEEYVPGGRR